nr:MAG TPA: hypothetical protein [Caudoviricetes sp.]
MASPPFGDHQPTACRSCSAMAIVSNGAAECNTFLPPAPPSPPPHTLVPR